MAVLVWFYLAQATRRFFVLCLQQVAKPSPHDSKVFAFEDRVTYMYGDALVCATVSHTLAPVDNRLHTHCRMGRGS